MKEITRIHIAKVAYDIELEAKKDIEQYMAALERYANDPDILDDIEIRVTELLAEHGVQAGGVITGTAIEAVRAQLGEPSDFASADTEPDVDTVEVGGEGSRRVYRDTDNGMLGGVLAGLARYLSVDPLWVRLVFIVLLFASFGTATIIYLVLWLVIPPAETAAEKLRMSGQPVTLASIKELVTREDQRSEKTQAMRRALSSIGGIFLVLVAIGGLFAVVAVVAGIGWTGYPALAADFGGESWWIIPMMVLLVLSGLLFSALFFVLASAVFQRKWSKRIGTAVIAIIATGLVVFVGGVGMGMYGYASEQERIASLSETRRIELAANVKDVTHLHVPASMGDAVAGHIEYTVSDTPRVEVTGLPGVEPHILVSDDGKTMTVQLTETGEQQRHFWNYYTSPTFRIYGPALESIELEDTERSLHYYNKRAQSVLRVVGEKGSFSLAGRYENVGITAKNTAAIALGDAAIEHLEVNLAGGSVTAGVVRTLTVTQSDVCPAREYHDERGSLEVQAVSSGKMQYNGTSQNAQNVLSECGGIIIGDDNDDSYDYREDTY